MPTDHAVPNVGSDYTAALGLAIFCFADLEWNAIRCCERIEPGSMEDLFERTAGRVADTLLHLVERVEASPEQIGLKQAAARFRDLVGTRNNLVHAKPGATNEGASMLFRHGDPWTLAELDHVAQAFSACSARLNVGLQGLLSPSR